MFFVSAAAADQGWLTETILGATLSSAEWVLWILALLSVISVAVILERALFFARNRLAGCDQVAKFLERGEFADARRAVGAGRGMEAEVVREALTFAPFGADSAEQAIAAAIARERTRYERFLSFLGTLGSNAPFVGLFGTVLGIIKAFHDLGAMGGKGNIQQTVMAGISEALVATAVGLAVAIPAVVAYNHFNRSLKTLATRSQAMGHVLLGHLRAEAKFAANAAPASEVR